MRCILKFNGFDLSKANTLFFASQVFIEILLRVYSCVQINKRYLAPLFLAYDDLIQEKENMARQCQDELQTLKKRTEEVVRENQRYQLKGGAGSGSTARIEAAEWYVGVVVVCWLLNVPAKYECISGMNLLRQFYMLPH